MKAVHFGAGNIGRGFIGYLLRKSDYDLTFVDISGDLVKNINSLGKYKVITLGKTKALETVTDVKAVELNDAENLVKAIAFSDLITLSIGANHLTSTGKVLQKALRVRKRVNPGQSVDIVACENALFATDIIHRSIREMSTTVFLHILITRSAFQTARWTGSFPMFPFKKNPRLMLLWRTFLNGI